MRATQIVLHTIVWTLWATHTGKLQGEEWTLALRGAIMRATQIVLHTIVWTLWATHTATHRCRNIEGAEDGMFDKWWIEISVVQC